MWELGLSAIISLGQSIYRRFEKARGLSREFSKDIDDKVTYFVEVSRIQAAVDERLTEAIEDGVGPSADGGERTILRITDLLQEFTSAERRIAHLRKMTFFDNNRIGLQKLKKKDEAWLTAFYAEFARLDSSAQQRCADINAGVARVKTALKSWSAFFSTGEAQDELIKTVEQFVGFQNDLRAFLSAVHDLNENSR